MPDFSRLFLSTRGQPVKYKRLIIRLGDFIPVSDGDEFLLTFEHFGSEWEQGVDIGFVSKKNSIIVNDHTYSKGGSFWQSDAPKEVKFQISIKNKEDILLVHNAWKNPRGHIHSRHGGAAMIREDIPNGARYRCNDGHPDDNFDDLIFTLVKTKGVWEPPLEKSPYLKD